MSRTPGQSVWPRNSGCSESKESPAAPGTLHAALLIACLHCLGLGNSPAQIDEVSKPGFQLILSLERNHKARLIPETNAKLVINPLALHLQVIHATSKP